MNLTPVADGNGNTNSLASFREFHIRKVIEAWQLFLPSWWVYAIRYPGDVGCSE